jgi:hypothetical protein
MEPSPTSQPASADPRGEGPVRVIVWTALAALAVGVTIALAAWTGRPRELALDVPTMNFAVAGRDLSIERIRGLIERLASLGSRVTGYGDAQAADIILGELAGMGIAPQDIQVQPFRVPVPIARSARLVRSGAGDPGAPGVPLHPLWPNLARTSQTPAGGIRGPLVYVGRASDAELAGKTLQNAILVVDWDCGDEWLSAGEFGAKAVIFRDSNQGTGYTARRKFLTVPADIPRFFVAGADLPALDRLVAEDRGEVVLHCEMAWQEAIARNILAKVCDGQTPPNADDPDTRPVVFHAYYDSISVVPDLSPGAEQACGAAVALELARFFRNLPIPPRRSVYVLLTGGHGEALAGMTHFTMELRRGLSSGWREDEAGSPLARMGRPGLMVGLDLSSRSERMGVFCVGNFRGQWEGRLRPKFTELGLKLDKFAADQSAAALEAKTPPSFVDCINLTMGRGWWTYFPYPAAFESELPAIAGYPAITLSTLNDDRRSVDTPHDTPDRMQFDLLGRQILCEPQHRVGLANLAMALASWQGPFVSSSLTDVWAHVGGRVVWLDQEKDYTPSAPLARAMVFLKANRGDKFLMGTRGLAAVMTDGQGRFQFNGLLQATENRDFLRCTVEAYGPATRDFINANPRAAQEFLKVVRRAGQEAREIEPDGSILFGADMARPGEYPWKVQVLKEDQELNLVCFPCRSISLFALTDPREYVDLSDPQILDAATQGPPFQFGQSVTDASPGRTEENCITIWADPTIRVRLTFGFGYQTRRLILINNSPDSPVGEGFLLRDLSTIPSMVLQGASDMWNLDESRFQKLLTHGIGNPRVRRIHEESRAYLDQARSALDRRDYREYRIAASNAWALESRAYSELLSMTNNMIRGVLFYLAVLIPFSYCLERLLIASGTVRGRIVGMVVIFAVSFAVLAVAHPAFRFTMTPLVVLLAFVILALAGVVSLLVVGKFDRMLQERKQAAVGLHEDVRNTGRVALYAIDLGIANIRRRPKRGFLTAATIVLVTFTLLSFTSLVPELNISKLPHLEGEASTYKGLLIRSRNWAPLPAPLYDSLRRTYGAEGSVVAGRAWFFSDYSGKLSQIDLSVSRPEGAAAGGQFTAVALMCMETTEPAVSGIDKALLPGGRWFRGPDDLGIILPAHVASQLGLEPNDVGRKTVRLFGKELELIGLIDSTKMDQIRDIDGEPITPVNFVLQELMQAQSQDAKEVADTLQRYVHFASHELAIIPLEYGRRLGASFRSIAVRTAANLDVDAEADRFARRSNMTILASDARAVTLHASMDSESFSAAGQVLVPTFLGFVMVLGTMLGSVYERRREIFVYNSVGLSPANVSSLFLAEAGVYAILGASLGYLLGQAVCKTLLATGMLGGLTLNYSAGVTVFVTVLTMVIVLLSTLYPARQAFLAAVPESHRAGDALADQAADRIGIFMPFVATPGSVLGMQAYMHEFLDSLQGVTIGTLAVDNLTPRLEGQPGRPEPVLAFRAWLAPFDLGVSHDVELRIVYRQDRQVYQYHLTAARFSGDHQNWRRLTPRFLLTIRKQLLMWRILSGQAIEDYIRRGEKLFGAPAAGDHGA